MSVRVSKCFNSLLKAGKTAADVGCNSPSDKDFGHKLVSLFKLDFKPKKMFLWLSMVCESVHPHSSMFRKVFWKKS